RMKHVMSKEGIASGPEGRADAGQQEERQGMVWVKGGKLYCKPSPDRYPIIIPKPGAAFLKNGALVESAAVVRENDVLEVQHPEEVREPVWDIQVTSDEMEASIRIEPGVRIRRRLKDREADY